MSRVLWSPRAERELEDIVYYIRERDGRPDTARRIASQIYEAVEMCASKKYPVSTHPDAPEGWHYFRHKRWLIFYQVLPDGVEVMRVIDGTRDLPRQFEAPA